MKRFLILAALTVATLSFLAGGPTMADAAVPNADLAVSVAASNLNPVPGTTVILRARVRNFGPDAAATVTFNLNAPGYEITGPCRAHTSALGLTCVDDPTAIPAGWTCNVGTDSVTCTAPSLGVNKSSLFAFNATAIAVPDGRPRPVGTVASATHDPVPGNNRAVAQSTLP